MPLLRVFIIYCTCFFVGVLFDAFHFPAATLLGPMVIAIVFSLQGWRVSTPKSAVFMIQAVIGLVAGKALNVTILQPYLSSWWVFMAVALLVLVVCQMMGYSLAKLRVLPGSTAIWGCAPGGASAMVLMAESHGTNPSLVAFMQYIRVAMVSFLAAVVAHFLSLSADIHPSMHMSHWLDHYSVSTVIQTILIIVLASYLGVKSCIPAGCLLVSMLVSALCMNTHAVDLQVPVWLLDLCYLVFGVNIGMRFNRGIVKEAWFALPKILLSIVALIVLCGTIAMLLVVGFHVTPLTAYLATTPGGLDAVTAIALSSHGEVNLGFVMSMQIVRLLLVVLLAPPMANYASKRFNRHYSA
ncbi:AbrB family transcriptional regulator [Vibrio rarus]|uniref:AbrB family transcriptional regulator n=1 Tax=Vibrio rarus TaxID=413403 RepID=UPI0021C3CF5F|nr:AbrB family transcriptional regulator [Vibrio rarus]